MNKGRLIVISGPSGVGKSSLLKKLFSEMGDRIKFSVSSTSRAPRKGELDGIDYNFISATEFKKGIEDNRFLEWALVHGNYYGTDRTIIDAVISNGKDCLLDIDVQGGTALMDDGVNALYIFIAPPSVETLNHRLLKRGTETDEQIQLRVSNALHELKYQDRYEFVVVNDDFDTAYNELISIIYKKTED